MNRFKKWILKKLTEREIKAVLDGKEGPMLKQLAEWLMTHRTQIGLGLASVSAGLLVYPDPKIHQLGVYAGVVASYLLGAGHTDSDSTKKAEIMDAKFYQ